MTVLVDTREKKHAHILAYFDRHGIEYREQKLDEGDYMIEGADGITVDRKQNLGELSRNLLNAQDHTRFWKEVRRCRQNGKKLIVLCEHGGKIKSIEDVALWTDKYTGVTGRSLRKEIYRVHMAYGVEFLFCDKRSTGRRIIEILTEAHNR